MCRVHPDQAPPPPPTQVADSPHACMLSGPVQIHAGPDCPPGQGVNAGGSCQPCRANEVSPGGKGAQCTPCTQGLQPAADNKTCTGARGQFTAFGRSFGWAVTDLCGGWSPHAAAAAPHGCFGWLDNNLGCAQKEWVRSGLSQSGWPHVACAPIRPPPMPTPQLKPLAADIRWAAQTTAFEKANKHMRLICGLPCSLHSSCSR